MERRQAYPSISGLRGLAILGVVFFHTLLLTPLMQTIPFSTLLKVHGGRFGIFSFFMISGFLMSHNYFSAIHNRELRFGDFLRRRLLRIYPIYLASNLAMLGIYILRDGLSSIDLDEFLMMVFLQAGGGLTYVQPYNYPTWFVSSLLICYLLYFAVTYHTKNTTQYRCCLVALVLIGYILTKNIWTVFFLYTANGFAVLAFFLGVMIGDAYPLLTAHRKRQLLVGSAAILIIVGFMAVRFGFHNITTNIASLFSFFICPEVLFIALACPPVVKILQWKPIRFLGKISTSIFFWHVVLHEVFMTEIYSLGILPEIYEVRYVLYWVVLILFSWLSEFVFSTYLPRKALQKKS